MACAVVASALAFSAAASATLRLRGANSLAAAASLVCRVSLRACGATRSGERHGLVCGCRSQAVQAIGVGESGPELEAQSLADSSCAQIWSFNDALTTQVKIKDNNIEQKRQQY